MPWRDGRRRRRHWCRAAVWISLVAVLAIKEILSSSDAKMLDMIFAVDPFKGQGQEKLESAFDSMPLPPQRATSPHNSQAWSECQAMHQPAANEGSDGSPHRGDAVHGLPASDIRVDSQAEGVPANAANAVQEGKEEPRPNSDSDRLDAQDLQFERWLLGLPRLRRWEPARELELDLERPDYRLDAQAYLVLARAACIAFRGSRPKVLDILCQLLQRMARRRIKALTAMYNTAFVACYRARDWHRAIELFQEMEEQRVVPDEDSFRHLFHALYLSCLRSYGRARQYRDGDHEWAVLLFEKMKQYQITPTVELYTRAMSLCDEQQEPAMALHLFRDMGEAALVPDQEAYELVVKASAKNRQWQDALALLEASWQHDRAPKRPASYTFTAEACARASLWAASLGILGEMCARRIAPQDRTYMLTIQACEAAGQKHFVNSLQHDRKEAAEAKRQAQAVEEAARRQQVDMARQRLAHLDWGLKASRS